jgi:hypothetical protein
MGSDETAKGGQLRLEDKERIGAPGMTIEVFLPEAIGNWLRGEDRCGCFQGSSRGRFCGLSGNART